MRIINIIYLLKIIVRGGIRLRGTILTISLFISIVVSALLLASGYVNEASELSGLIGGEKYYYSFNPMKSSVEILYATMDIDNLTIILLSPSDIKLWLEIHGANIRRIGDGRIYIGFEIYRYVGDRLDEIFPAIQEDIGYVVHAGGYVGSSIIFPRDIIYKLGLKWNRVYESKDNFNASPTPSFKHMLRDLSTDVNNIIININVILQLILIFGSSSSAYLALRGSGDFKNLFRSLNMGSFDMISTILTLSMVISSISIIIGFSIGTVSVHATSFILHKLFGISFIRPELSSYLINVMVVDFILISTSLFIVLYQVKRWLVEGS